MRKDEGLYLRKQRQSRNFLAWTVTLFVLLFFVGFCFIQSGMALVGGILWILGAFDTAFLMAALINFMFNA